MKSPSDQPAETWWRRLTRPQRAAAIGGGVLVLAVVLALALGGGEPKETKTTVLTNGQEEQPLETANPRPEIWKNPVVLFAGADDSVDRYDPAVTDGGLTLVFVAGLPRQGADLYLSTRAQPNDEWSEPEHRCRRTGPGVQFRRPISFLLLQPRGRAGRLRPLGFAK
jgi:hypothetical protein